MFYFKEDEDSLSKSKAKDESEEDVQASASQEEADDALYDAVEAASARLHADEAEYDTYTGKVLLRYSKQDWNSYEAPSMDGPGLAAGFTEADTIAAYAMHDLQIIASAAQNYGWTVEFDTDEPDIMKQLRDLAAAIEDDDKRASKYDEQGPIYRERKYSYEKLYADATVEAKAEISKTLQESKFESQVAGWLDMLDVCR